MYLNEKGKQTNKHKRAAWVGRLLFLPNKILRIRNANTLNKKIRIRRVSIKKKLRNGSTHVFFLVSEKAFHANGKLNMS